MLYPLALALEIPVQDLTGGKSDCKIKTEAEQVSLVVSDSPMFTSTTWLHEADPAAKCPGRSVHDVRSAARHWGACAQMSGPGSVEDRGQRTVADESSSCVWDFS